jgi:heme A synthase
MSEEAPSRSAAFATHSHLFGSLTDFTARIAATTVFAVAKNEPWQKYSKEQAVRVVKMRITIVVATVASVAVSTVAPDYFATA